MIVRPLAASLALAGLAPAVAAPAAVQCDVRVTIADPQGTPTNFRAGPARTARKLFDLPSDALVELHVIGRSGEWFLIDGIDNAETEQPIHRDRLWVHRSQLVLSVAGGDHRLYAGPNKASAALMKLTPDGNMLDLRDCQGDWVRVIVDNRQTGWMAPDAQCSNPMTTCS